MLTQLRVHQDLKRVICVLLPKGGGGEGGGGHSHMYVTGRSESLGVANSKLLLLHPVIYLGVAPLGLLRAVLRHHALEVPKPGT